METKQEIEVFLLLLSIPLSIIGYIVFIIYFYFGLTNSISQIIEKIPNPSLSIIIISKTMLILFLIITIILAPMAFIIEWRKK